MRKEAGTVKQKNEGKQYVEQLIYSFKKWETIEKAWQDCLLLFPQGSELHKGIEEALHVLEDEESKQIDNFLEKAFGKINQVCRSKGVVVLHLLLAQMIQLRMICISVLDWFLNEIYEDNGCSFWYSCEKGRTLCFEEEFLVWTLSFSVFLQHEKSVYQVLQSREITPSQYFEKEVEIFREELYEHPYSPEPYRNFFKEKRNPYIRQIMMLLYSVNSDNVSYIVDEICLVCHHLMHSREERKNHQKNIRTLIRTWCGKVVFTVIFIGFLYCAGAMLDMNLYYGQLQTYYEQIRTCLENLQFSQEAIQDCKNNAMEQGYRLEIQCFGEEKRDARIRLYGGYVFPLFGTVREVIIDGYAR